MIALIQRVLNASVTVGGETVGKIGPGLLVLLGVEQGDNEQKRSACVNACWDTAFSATRTTR